MNYLVFLEGVSKPELVKNAGNYSTHGDFIDFYIGGMPSGDIFVASYRSKDVKQIMIATSDDKNKQREEKLSRILRGPGLFERVGKKLDKVFRKKKII